MSYRAKRGQRAHAAAWRRRRKLAWIRRMLDRIFAASDHARLQVGAEATGPALIVDMVRTKDRVFLINRPPPEPLLMPMPRWSSAEELRDANEATLRRWYGPRRS